MHREIKKYVFKKYKSDTPVKKKDKRQGFGNWVLGALAQMHHLPVNYVITLLNIVAS